MIKPNIAPGVEVPFGGVVKGAAVILVASDILVLGPGPSGLYTTAHRDAHLGVRVTRACYSGTLEGYAALINSAQGLTDESRATAHQWVEQIREHFAGGA